MNTTVLLSTAYLAPVQYYAKLYAYPHVCIEACEHYVKQTWRNRCAVANAQGVQQLIVPVEKPDSPGADIRLVRISDHGNWRHLHWNALESAYRNSPFFEYYADDLLPFYTRRWRYLFDFNLELMHTLCTLMGFQPHVSCTTSYQPSPLATDDYRHLIAPKGAAWQADTAFRTVLYYQVFAQRHGFLPNLSVADLLFNMGPESLLVLRDATAIR